MKKEELPVYEIYKVSPMGEVPICTTCSLKEAKKYYAASRPAHLRINGVEQSIADADKLMYPGFNRSVNLANNARKPPKKPNIHQLKPAE